MPPASWWSIALLLAIFPIAVVLLFSMHRALPERLTFFYASGLLMNHWMHVWSYRLHDRLSNGSAITKLNVLFALEVDWRLSLVLGIVFYAVLYTLLRSIWNPERPEVSFAFISLIGLASIIGSQVAASGVPKLAIEIGLLAIYLLGLVAWKYFLSYSKNSRLTDAEKQSDALTSFGIMLSLLSLWVPAALAFGSFLFQYYQSHGDLGVQLQMTRYSAGVAYSLFGLGIVILETLGALIRARGKV